MPDMSLATLSRCSPQIVTCWHLALIFTVALLFTHLPQAFTGIPLSYQLSGDAECYINIWQELLNPQIFAHDLTMPRILPQVELRLLEILAKIGLIFMDNLYVWSIFLSLAMLFVFLAGLYFVTWYGLGNQTYAFLIALFGVFPVRLLGAIRFGFQALGFTPRQLAVSISLFLILIYLGGIRRESRKMTGLFFFLCGVLANFYPPLFAQMALTFLLAEAFRLGGLRPVLWAYAGLALLGVLPSMFDILAHFGPAQPVDVAILRKRHGYLLLFPLSGKTLYYLRTVLAYSIFVLGLYFFLFRKCEPNETRPLQPWFALAKASFTLSVLGLIIENTTPFMRFFISRTSLWFALSSTVIIVHGVFLYFRKARKNKLRLAPYVCLSTFFVMQSHLFPIGVQMWKGYQNRAVRQELLQTAEMLKSLSSPEDLVVAPTGPGKDLANSLRTYSLRPVYVAYKDGGASLINEARGRLWWERYQKVRNLFHAPSPERLLDFMSAEGIQFALLPRHLFPSGNDILHNRIVFETPQFLLIGPRKPQPLHGRTRNDFETVRPA